MHVIVVGLAIVGVVVLVAAVALVAIGAVILSGDENPFQ